MKDAFLSIVRDKLKTEAGTEALFKYARDYLKNVTFEAGIAGMKGHQGGTHLDATIRLILERFEEAGPKRYDDLVELRTLYKRACDRATKVLKSGCAHRRTPKGLCTDCDATT